MKTNRTIALSLLTTVLSVSGLAQAGNTLTRAQVRAEALEAIRTGDVMDYETGRKLNELYPLAYPQAAKIAQVPVATKPVQPVQGKEVDNLEHDLITQRHAQALARRQADSADNHLAGVTR